MNISITCRHKTQVSRYKKKMIQELRSIHQLDESISRINLIFSFTSNKPNTFSLTECHLSVESQSEKLEIIKEASSEIRAFNLCFEQLLYQLLKKKEMKLTERKVKSVFPYISIEPDLIAKPVGDWERRT